MPTGLETGTYSLAIKTQKSKQFPSKETVCEVFEQSFIVE